MSADGFGYKTAWLAVRTTSPESVCAALDLAGVTSTPASRGLEQTERFAFKAFVLPPIDGWVLCVSNSFFQFVEGDRPDFGALAARLSWNLEREVQFFATHRVVETHAWAKAVDGKVLRAYAYNGEAGEVPTSEGAPTPEEIELRLDEYPNEEDVVSLAGRWSLNPTELDGVADGWLGTIKGAATGLGGPES